MDLGDNSRRVAQGDVARPLLYSGHYCFHYKHQYRRESDIVHRIKWFCHPTHPVVPQKSWCDNW